MRTLLLLIIYIIALGAYQAEGVNGGIVQVLLGEFGEVQPKAFWDAKPVRGERLASGEWAAVVGIPIDTIAGATLAITHTNDQNQTIKTAFSVRAKSSPVQKISIDSKFVELDAAALKRTAQESGRMHTAISAFSEPLSDFTLHPPLAQFAPISGLFGSKRVFNNRERRPHSGMDIAAPKGTTVFATNHATVALTDDFFFCGKFVLLDHGGGLFSLFCHLDKSLVQAGERVQTAQPIGVVGATGRVTGAHLHWTAIVNQAYVDPLALLDERERQAILTEPRQ